MPIGQIYFEYDGDLLDRKEITAIVIRDLDFDKVCKLIKLLQFHIVKLAESLLNDRNFTVKVTNAKSLLRNISAGVFQESCCLYCPYYF